jgi:hypothetical protein
MKNEETVSFMMTCIYGQHDCTQKYFVWEMKTVHWHAACNSCELHFRLACITLLPEKLPPAYGVPSHPRLTLVMLGTEP